MFVGHLSFSIYISPLCRDMVNLWCMGMWCDTKTTHKSMLGIFSLWHTMSFLSLVSQLKTKNKKQKTNREKSKSIGKSDIKQN